MFSIRDKVVVITGGAGILGSAMSREFATRGARVAILDRRCDQAELLAAQIREAGHEAVCVQGDVLEFAALEESAALTLAAFGRVDILINAAGGNNPDGTTLPGETTFFDLPAEALQHVSNLNFMGTVLPSQVFGRLMASQGAGTIINVSSMAASRALSRVVAYSAAKSAVENFTRWLAVHLATEFTPNIRVNAIAPGFFLTKQNRYLLLAEQTNELTERGRQILAHTPMNRFGTPEDLLGPVIWLASDASNFVTGAVIPIDGGFSAFGGV